MKKFGKQLAVSLLLGMLMLAAACGTSKKDKNEADMAGSSAAESFPQKETDRENTEAFDGDKTNNLNNSVTDPEGTDAAGGTQPDGGITAETGDIAGTHDGTDSAADNIMDAGRDVIDGAGNMVEDAVHGAADAVKDLTNGAADAGRDAGNAVSDAAGRAAGK